MDETTLTLLHSLLNKMKDRIDRIVFFIKNLSVDICYLHFVIFQSN